jgi:cyclin-dependent kinase
MERYQKMEKIGAGMYGTVYKAKDNATGEILALKRIRLVEDEDNDMKQGIPSTTIREISLLKELKHKNIVRLYDVVNSEDRTLTLVFEYMDQDLKKYLDCNEGGLDPIIIKYFLYQLLDGITHCHFHRVLHRDLKPPNLLINIKGELKIADFGLARALGISQNSYTHEVVTLWYRAPDVLLGSRNYSTSVDIWSIGCIFAEMVRGKTLFPGKTEGHQLDTIFSLLGTPTVAYTGSHELPEWKNDTVYPAPVSFATLVPGLETAGLDLMQLMLSYDPARRISAAEARYHPYFDDLPLNLK